MKIQLHVGTKADLSFNLRHFWSMKSFRRPRFQRKTDCHFKISYAVHFGNLEKIALDRSNRSIRHSPSPLLRKAYQANKRNTNDKQHQHQLCNKENTIMSIFLALFSTLPGSHMQRKQIMVYYFISFLYRPFYIIELLSEG